MDKYRELREVEDFNRALAEVRGAPPSKDRAADKRGLLRAANTAGFDFDQDKGEFTDPADEIPF